jgi:predicted nucleic acid-binding protein
VTRCLLDTNIISHVVNPRHRSFSCRGCSIQRDEDLFIASLTLAELRRGILERPRGKKRGALDQWFSGPDGP